MRVLFAGDSITRGEIGADFTTLIRQSIPGVHTVNAGKNGYTFNLIIKSVMQILQADKEYDYLVLQGGYNDLLLPWFYERGGLFRFAYNTQLKKGHRPFDTSKHAFTFLQHSIQEIKKTFSGDIVLVEIACLGEKLDSNLNKKVREFNALLREIASRENISITSTNKLFADALSGKTTSGYCLDSFFAVTVLDRITHYFANKRQLHLTIDGVHLNSAGAAIFTEAILDVIKKPGSIINY